MEWKILPKIIHVIQAGCINPFECARHPAIGKDNRAIKQAEDMLCLGVASVIGRGELGYNGREVARDGSRPEPADILLVGVEV